MLSKATADADKVVDEAGRRDVTAQRAETTAMYRKTRQITLHLDTG